MNFFQKRRRKKEIIRVLSSIEYPTINGYVTGSFLLNLLHGVNTKYKDIDIFFKDSDKIIFRDDLIDYININGTDYNLIRFNGSIYNILRKFEFNTTMYMYDIKRKKLYTNSKFWIDDVIPLNISEYSLFRYIHKCVKYSKEVKKDTILDILNYCDRHKMPIRMEYKLLIDNDINYQDYGIYIQDDEVKFNYYEK